MYKFRSARRSERGFNLIEAAIVLGIVGLIVGGIWVAAAAVYENLRTNRATQQLLQIAQAVRTLHGSQTTIPNNNITTAMVAAKAVPSDMLDNSAATQPYNPWRGVVNIVGVSSISATAGPGFWVVFNGLPRNACIDLAVKNSGQGRDAGLEGVALAASAQTTPSGTGSTPPVDVSTAASSCTDTSSANSAAFLFRIRS